jgi:hypothetical protein
MNYLSVATSPSLACLDSLSLTAISVLILYVES